MALDKKTTDNLRLHQNLNLIDKKIKDRLRFIGAVSKIRHSTNSPQQSSTPTEIPPNSSKKRRSEIPLTAAAEFRKKMMKQVFQKKSI